MRSIASFGCLLALVGCSTAPVVVRETPPEALLLDCPEPTLDIRTNRDLSHGLLAYRDALRRCNNDKSALLEWFNVPR